MLWEAKRAGYVPANRKGGERKAVRHVNVHMRLQEELAIGGALTTGGSGAASPTAAGTTTAMSAAHHMGLIVEASGAQAQSQTRGPLQARSSSLGPRTFSVLRSQDSVIHSGPRVKVGLDGTRGERVVVHVCMYRMRVCSYL